MRSPRPARSEDAEAIARIYNEGIEDRLGHVRDAAPLGPTSGWLDDGFPLWSSRRTAMSRGPRPRLPPGRDAYAGSATSPSTCALGAVRGAAGGIEPRAEAAAAASGSS